MSWITQRIEFDSGHRVLGHGGKCRHLHGHRYVAEVVVSAKVMNDLGMVIDFGNVKRIIGDWIDSYWDHNLILNTADPLLKLGMSHEVFAGREPFIMPGDMNPTAENMAQVLFTVCVERLEFMYQPDLFVVGDNALTVQSVTIHETPNCRSTFHRGETC